jgi:drug/metabolite transporter (DMT)-like permease
MWWALVVATLSVSPPQRLLLRAPASANHTANASGAAVTKTIAYRADDARSFQIWASLGTNPELSCDRPCRLVHDSASADAVVWNFRWIDVQTAPLKPAGQKWLLTSYIESPQTMRPRPGAADWEVTPIGRKYQRNMDLLAPHIDATFNFNSHANYVRPRFRLEPLAAPSTPPAVDLSGRTKLVLWYVSNCKTPSEREIYAQQLLAHLPAGSSSQFGSCNGQTCPQGSACERTSDARHKFYLAFENSLCDGYITEKALRAYEKGMVPVMMGGAGKEDYVRLGLPADSFIHVSDFASPALLAAYLQELDRDDAKYRAYFAWRGRAKLVSGEAAWQPALCDLCRDLHDDTLKTSSEAEVQQWWQGSCRRPPWGLAGQPVSLVHEGAGAKRLAAVLGLSARSWAAVLVAGSVLLLPLWYYGFHAHGAVLGEVGTAGGLSDKVAWGVTWYVCTVVMNVSNKQAVGTSPTALAAIQMAFSCVVLALCWPALRIHSRQDVRDLLPWLTVCVFFAGLLVSSLISFQHESLSTMVLMASLRPLYAHAVEWGCFAEQPNRMQLFGCALLVVGSAGYLLSGVRGSINSVTAVGCGALAVNGVVSAVDRCYQRYYLYHKPLNASPTALVLTMNLGALVLVLAAFPLWRGDLLPLAARASAWTVSAEGLIDLAWVLLSCLGGVAIGFAGIGFQRVVTAAEFLVIAIGSRALTFLVLDHYYYGADITVAAVVGLSVVMYGTWVHSTAKNAEKPARGA